MRRSVRRQEAGRRDATCASRGPRANRPKFAPTCLNPARAVDVRSSPSDLTMEGCPRTPNTRAGSQPDDDVVLAVDVCVGIGRMAACKPILHGLVRSARSRVGAKAIPKRKVVVPLLVVLPDNVEV